MTTEFLMPQLSETSGDGTILKWLINPGDEVIKGQILVQVESDKAIVELESPRPGMVLRRFFEEGDVVQARTVLAVLGETGETAPDLDPRYRLSAQRPDQRLARPRALSDRTRERSGPRPLDGDRQRRQGHESRSGSRAGISSSLEQSGRSEPLGESSTATPFHEGALKVQQLIPLSRARQATGAHLLRSLRTAPHAYIEVEADATDLVRVREDMKAAQPEPIPSYTALFVQCVARALKASPQLNATLREGQICVWSDINIGIVVTRDRSLIVPVIRSADEKTIAEISQTIRDFTARGANHLRVDEYNGGTFTISNLGMYGADSVLSILNQGQAALLSIGRIRAKPAVVGDQISIRSMVRMTLAFDHRVLDGATAARFLSQLELMLAQPGSWIQ